MSLNRFGSIARQQLRPALGVIVALCVCVPPAQASDQIYFSATTNITDQILAKINAETVRIDMAVWHLTEHAISIALLNRFKAGVPVRLLADRGEMFEIDPKTKAEIYWLANEGVPIRLRVNPNWYPEISHWKVTIFAGQNLVTFGSANYTPFELAPVSSTNYKDETVMFTDDPALVNAIRTKFDVMWNDTTPEPESLVPAPPYLKDWNDACATEPTGNCADYHTLYPNPKPMIISTARLEPDNPIPSDLIFGQGPSFNNRLIQEINNEATLVQLVVFRLTVPNITNALLAKWAAGIPIQLMIEPDEYLNRKWPEFWLTHAYLDKLWAAGVPIKTRKHEGITHMKTIVTSAYATNASSNFAASWERDVNYFVPKAAKLAIYQAIKTRVTAMWNDTTAFQPFVPQPPDAPTLSSPISSATAVPVTTSLIWNRAVFATSYDVYLGSSSSNLALVGNVPAQLVNDPPATYSWTPSTPLQAGATYFWKVASRTFATPVNGVVVNAPIRSFTTAAAAPVGVPTPWSAQDIGSVGRVGSASYSNGTFAVTGAGSDIWGAADSFQYVSQAVSGDTQIVARVTRVDNTNTFAKAGVMLRQSLTANAAHVLLDVRPNGEIEFMTRSSSGGSTTWLSGASGVPPVWLRLVRTGSTVTGAVSFNGSTWTTVGSSVVSIPASARVGLAVTSHDTNVLNTSTFDAVTVGSGGSPQPTASNIVVYASDVPVSGLHGSWARVSDTTSPGGIKLATGDNGISQLDSPLASPTHYVDVNVSVVGGVPYALWLRLKAAANSKFNDAVWVQFSNARVNGSPVFPLQSTSGLLVNLATDSTATSLVNWGWQNSAYWLSQPATFTFPASGVQTLRIQIREDGVALDQIVLSPNTYLTTSPGKVTNDTTIVPKR